MNKARLEGKRFGRLVVIAYAGKGKRNARMWLCKCDCGNEKVASTHMLNSGHVKSCGCLVKDGGHRTHGLSNTRLYTIHKKMKDRCLNPKNKRYADYGGRGIKICDEWLGKEGIVNFYEWAMANGYSNDLTVDRIDNDGNYEPSNCRWATYLKQANNARSNHLLFHNGKYKTLSEWCRHYNLNYNTMYSRIVVKKMDVDDALLTKIGGIK